MDFEEKIEKKVGQISRNLWKRAEKDLENCYSFTELASFAGKKKVSEVVQNHLAKCSLCLKIFQSLRFPQKGVLEPKELMAAAGARWIFTSIPDTTLVEMGFPPRCHLICEEDQDHYWLRFESDIPIMGELVFYRGGQEIFRITVSEQLPKEGVPKKVIEGWEKVFFFRRG